MINNKIKIPWYRRNIGDIGTEVNGIEPLSFNLPPISTTPKPKLEPKTVRQPVRVPVTSPVTAPNFQPDWQPKPFPLPLPFPPPIPVPEQKPNNPNPAPKQPAFPAIPAFPTMFSNPNFDWSKHFQEISKNLPTPTPQPQPEKKGIFQKSIESILSPFVKLLILNEVKNQYIKVNITEPIYAKMLTDPVLGIVLREAEKANMDAGTVGTILANFNWENGDYKELEKTLAVGIGIAGAARLMVFIIGRKILFRI
jgi:hypothetical protein